MREHTMYSSAIKDSRILVLSSVIYYWCASANHLKYQLYSTQPPLRSERTQEIRKFQGCLSEWVKMGQPILYFCLFYDSVGEFRNEASGGLGG
jgi:hypothetical protein